MRFIKQIALGVLAAELLLAAVLLVGLVLPLPGSVELKIVQSGSMEPAIAVGSVVVVVPESAYAVGDIITFGDDTKKKVPTTHRVIALEREAGSVRYITKGDANEEADNTQVEYGAVVGKVVTTVPRLGFVLDFARSEQGFLFMLVIPAGLVVLDELLTLYGMTRKKRVTQVPTTQATVVPMLTEVPDKQPQPRVFEPMVRPTSRMAPERTRLVRANCLDLRSVRNSYA